MDPLDDKHTKEYNSLDKVLKHLVNHGLLSKIERRIIVSYGTLEGRHSAIYQLMRKKTPAKASDILKIMTHFHATGYSMSDLSCFQNLKSSNKMDNDNNLFGNNENKTNAMLNTTVVKNVFQYLKLEEILKCRLVCEMWSTVADPIVRKRARIVFGNLEPDRFVRIFKNYLPLQPFTAFVFNATENKDASKIKRIHYFFEKWGRKIKELSWNKFLIRTEEGEDIEKMNISLWIRAAKNLKYLSILNDCERTTFEISLSSLRGIETLILNTCYLDLDEAIKISPSKIIFAYITFCTGKKIPEPESFSLNTIIDFKEVKYLSISRYEGITNKFETSPELDFDKEPAKLDKLVLENLDSLNWQNGQNWQVNYLLIHNMDVDTKINMIIQELHISSVDWYDSKIDLSAFPDTIRKLTILRGNHMKFQCTQPVNLPNLKHLCIDFIGDVPVHFSNFLICLSLEDITFNKYCPSKSNYPLENFDPKQNLNLDLAIIPASVKAIKLHNKVNFIGDNGVLNLDKLVLEDYSLLKVEGILKKHIRPKLLVLNWRKDYESNDSLFLFMTLNKRYLENIIVGKFYWTFWKFEGTCLSKVVDKQSTHYEFKRNAGVSITSDKFDEQMTLFSCAFDKKELQIY